MVMGAGGERHAYRLQNRRGVNVLTGNPEERQAADYFNAQGTSEASYLKRKREGREVTGTNFVSYSMSGIRPKANAPGKNRESHQKISPSTTGRYKL